MSTHEKLFQHILSGFLVLLLGALTGTGCERKTASADQAPTSSSPRTAEVPGDTESVVEPREDAENALKLRFGVYTSEKPTAMYRQFQPVTEALTRDLEERLGQPVEIELTILSSYEEGLSAITGGRVDFMRVGPASYILARERDPGVRLLAMELKKGKKTFRGTIVVRKDSSIQSLEDLPGKRFAFGDERSTIGRYLSQRILLREGIRASDLARFEYLGRHDTVARAVAVGDFDAGALKASTLKKADPEGHLRVLVDFENVTKPWISRPGLPEKIYQAISGSLQNLDDPDALKAMKVTGWTEATLEDYAVIEEAMSQAEQFGG